MDNPQSDRESQPARPATGDGGTTTWEAARRRFDGVYNDYLNELERICNDARAHVDRAAQAYRRSWLEASLELGNQDALQSSWESLLKAQANSLGAVDAAGRADAAWKKLIQGLRQAWAEAGDEAIDPCLLHGIGQALIAAAAYGQAAFTQGQAVRAASSSQGS